MKYKVPKVLVVKKKIFIYIFRYPTRILTAAISIFISHTCTYHKIRRIAIAKIKLKKTVNLYTTKDIEY